MKRNAISRSLFQHSRPCTPIPERSVSPSPYHTQVWRPPRSKPGTRQECVPTLVQDTRYQLPWRAERQRQRLQAPLPSGSGRRRDAASIPYPAVTTKEMPYHYRQASGTESYHRRVTQESARFPERRPIRTRTYASTAEDQCYKDVRPFPERRGHRFTPRDDGLHHDYSYHREHDQTKHRPERYPTPLDLSHVHPSPRSEYAHTTHSQRPASNRWSFSSESSTSSGHTTFSLSPTLCPSSPGLGYDLPFSPEPPEIAIPQAELGVRFSRRPEPERRHSRVMEHSWILYSQNDSLSVDDDEHERSSPEVEDGDQTIVYTNCEVIARDQRFAPPHQRTRHLDGVTLVHRPQEHEWSEQPGPFGRAEWVRREDHGRRKRAYAFPMWAEPPPRHMRDQRREGVRYRYRADLEDIPIVQQVHSQRRHEQAGDSSRTSPAINNSARRPSSSPSTSASRNPRFVSR